MLEGAPLATKQSSRNRGEGKMFKTIDSIAVRSEGVILLLGRLAIGALFLPTGLRHLMNLGAFAEDIGKDGMMGPLMPWAVVAAVVEFFSALAIVVGLKARLGALLLTLFTIAAAFLAQSPEFRAVDARRAHPLLPESVVDDKGHLRTSPDRHRLEAFFGAVFQRRA